MSGPLRKSLPYLPLNIQSRVELWLTFRKLKPSSIIVLRNSKLSSIKRVTGWLKRTNLIYKLLDEDKIIVSYEKTSVDKLKKIWHKNTPKSDYEKGILLGYPIETVKAFEKNRSSLTCITAKDFPRNSLDYYQYITFLVRKGHEESDSKISKFWSECIRTDQPLLAKWYEEIISKLSK